MDRRVDAHPVIRAVTGHRGHGLRDLIEQRADLRGVIDGAVGQRGGHDLPALRIHADMQFPPGAPPLGPVLLDHPLAGSAQLQPGAVHQQVERSAGAGLRARQRHRSGPPGDGGMIRHR